MSCTDAIQDSLHTKFTRYYQMTQMLESHASKRKLLVSERDNRQYETSHLFKREETLSNIPANEANTSLSVKSDGVITKHYVLGIPLLL